MTMTAPSLAQIKAQVAAIRQKVPQARVIGIRSIGRWAGEPNVRDSDECYAIHQCDSPLSFRLALRQPTTEQTTKVLITSLSEQDLGDDILLRLAKRRLFQIDPWQIVRSLFDAHAVDPRLSQHAWIAESLLELIPNAGYPAARGGFLDSETVWPLLLKQAVGLQSESPDLTALLRWSLDADGTSRFRCCSESFRQAAIGWLTEKAGPVAALLLHCVERLERPDAVPIGLTASVVYHSGAIGKLDRASGKLEERFLGGTSPEAEHMQRWSAAATEAVRSMRETEPRIYRQTIQRADEILRDVRADEMAWLSDTSILGFDQRLARFGDALCDALGRGSWDLLDGLYEARQCARQHDQSTQETRRLERVDMALRLVRWLGSQGQAKKGSDSDSARHPEGRSGYRGLTPFSQPDSFADAANAQLREGGFLDWARLSLRSGDPVRKLSEAYARLFDQVRQIREQQSQVFAELLTAWTSVGSRGDDVIPVERALEQIVAPLAAEGLVLVIIIDGMSVAVCRELLGDVTRHEWIAISEPGRRFNRPGLATIPSVTEFSRTSLLCGRLCQGTQDDEKVGFAEHAALLERCRSGSPPVLFHKAGLQELDDSVLAAEVRKEIASTHRRVVGVVVNAVDDHLLKGEQIDTRWSRDEIKVLPALLHEARIARRLVVLISDHGHVLDCQAEGRPFRDDLAGGERWRPALGNAGADECLIQGSRVMAKGNRLIGPWSERVRYGIKKNGYHGGMTPQEMIVPIAVLSSTDDFPKGWSEQPIDTPVWWDEPSPARSTRTEPVLKLKPTKPQPSGTLFDTEEQEPTPEVAGINVPKWVTRLLASPVFEDQKRLGGRGIPADNVLTKLLSALDERGGKLTSLALARALECPPVRLPGLLAKAERIFNVDGYDVLRRDDASDTIELNRDLLLKQFDLVE